MRTASIRTQIETNDKVFDLNVFAWVSWSDGRAYVDTDLDFEFIDPTDDNSENYELVCDYLDQNYEVLRQEIEEKAEEDGESIGWNA
jgi:hypothetical protein